MPKRIAWVVICLNLLVTLVGLYFTQKIQFDYDVENFFPVDDPKYTFYEKYRQEFENDNDYLLIALISRDGIFQQGFLSQVDLLTKELREIEDVVKVNSPTDLKRPVYTPMGWIEIPVLHIGDPDRYYVDSVKIYRDSTLVGSFFAKDGKSVALILQNTQFLSKEKGDTLAFNVRKAIRSHGFRNYHVAGKAKTQGIYIRSLQREFSEFLGASVLLVILFLYLTFHSFRLLILPLLVVSMAIVWMLGIVAFLGKPLDIMMVLMPTILFVVGMSDVVHIQTKYIEILSQGKSKLNALQITVKEVGWATFLTSLTTAIGFLTLHTASIVAIRHFGFYTALGVTAAFVTAFTFFPSSLLLMPPPRVTKKARYNDSWQKFLRRLYSFVLSQKKTILLFFLIITLLSIYGITRIQINTFLLEDAPKDSRIKKDFQFFDDHYGGVRPFELAFWPKRKGISVYDPAVLREISKIESYLNKQYGVNNLISPASLVKSLNQGLHAGNPIFYQLPVIEKDWDRVLKMALKMDKSKLVPQVSANKQTLGRISGRSPDIGSKPSLEKNRELENFIKNEVDTTLISHRLTGSSPLIDENNRTLANNMLQGLAIAFVVIALIAGLMFRSFRMILIALLPNVIPLVMIAGIMGFFAIPLKLSTSVIFSISFGIAVDDTIHMISKFKLELNKGKGKLYALKTTYLSTGKAVIITSLILAAGFLILIFSSFGGTFYTGLFVSLTLIFALIADMTLLPLLIILLYRP
ncbi:efflux RND transporter permease subunit [Xanthovirga aplysinae]|uniref:efflux RND transporter permease subunit n=1 Tax=Xanthovirga aplysinae TaxID=2529853 RepID=UPI0012BD1F46|nr:MMPL family transporter [Xanthovirga aplysinae]MTI33133.1 hypothetical protein [Xanthovirga aplysinae]